MTASTTQLPPCPPDCARDCPTCVTVGEQVVARAAAFERRLDQWRRAGGNRYGNTDGGTTDREAGAA